MFTSLKELMKLFLCHFRLLVIGSLLLFFYNDRFVNLLRKIVAATFGVSLKLRTSKLGMRGLNVYALLTTVAVTLQ